jgi:hypothetical protein
LSENLIAAMEAGLLLFGTKVTKPYRTGDTTVMLNVATFLLRRTASLKEELAAAAPRRPRARPK